MRSSSTNNNNNSSTTENDGKRLVRRATKLQQRHLEQLLAPVLVNKSSGFCKIEKNRKIKIWKFGIIRQPMGSSIEWYKDLNDSLRFGQVMAN